MDTHERAKKAVNERWHPTIPRATHSGIINIAGNEIACDVLNDGRRVLRHKNIARAMGKGKPSNEGMKRALEHNIPVFLGANNLAPYLKEDFLKRSQEIYYKTAAGRKIIGYDASVLPESCKIYVQAESDGVLQKQQLPIAKVCKTMLYGLAIVGITALVDDATNYVEERSRNELDLILRKYISEELRKWTNKFPNEFFKQVYRLHGWEWPNINKNHPQYVGKIINKYVYDALPSGVKEELEKKNPTNENGLRTHRHHQFLTGDIGDDNLNKQIIKVITLMKVSNSLDEFNKFMQRSIEAG